MRMITALVRSMVARAHGAGRDRFAGFAAKSTDQLRFLLNWLAGEITEPTGLADWPGQGGIRGALKYLDAHVDESVLEDSARHCKLRSGLLQPGRSSP